MIEYNGKGNNEPRPGEKDAHHQKKNILQKQKRKQKKRREVKQTPSDKTVPTGIDFVSPTLVKETLPEESGVEGRYNDYLVEVGSTIEQARYYRSFFAEIKGGNTWASMLDPLILGEFGKGDTDVAIHVEPVDLSLELEDVKKRIEGLESDLITEKDDSRAHEMRDEIADLKVRQKRLRTNIEKPFRVSIQSVISSLSIKELKKFTNNLVRRFAGREVYMRSPDGKQLDALYNITPISQNYMYKEHSFSYETSNVADLFPFGHGGISHRTGIVLGYDDLGRPIYYDGWHTNLMNHNMVILGRAGGGKTFCTMTLTHRSAHIGIYTVIIDPKGDYRKFVTSMGCPYVDLSPNSKYRINFFDVDIEERNDGEQRVNIEETVQGVRAIVFKMLRIMDDSILTGRVKVKIENLIRKLYRDKGINEDPNSLIDQNKHIVKGNGGTNLYNLSGEYKTMPQLGDLFVLMHQENDLQEASELLRNFTRYGDSPTQAIFDTQSNVSIQNTAIFAFGLADLDEEIMRPLGLFIATKWQSTKFAKKNRHLRKRVVFDEAQTAMYEPETAQWLENEFRTVRFFNTSMCAVTQGFEVFARVEQGLGILKNAPTKIFLRQEPIDIEEVKGKFDLTEGEGSFLVHQAQKGLGIIRVDEEASIIKVDSTPYEFELFKTDPG
ncbi:VirB4 family type IV secretion system protein [Salibacterium aidingense]|uniref:VirB4 family type IV secretion system protein n=1 Tax=Salibacterium aidingense TaxID=384933 RepID=UPI0004028F6B|nr:DUF87 domain-containing protein [Salibacterium aidingense]